MLEIFRCTETIPCREDIAEYLNDQGLLGTAVEVGVWRGHFAGMFRRRWRGEKLILVDPWEDYPEHRYLTQDEEDPQRLQDKWFKDVMEKFEKYGLAVAIWRMTSKKAVELVDDHSLDFVYIDGDHSYDHVQQDLAMWWPKVKPGGVMAAHDVFNQMHIDVTNAVADFCMTKNLTADLIPCSRDKQGRFILPASCFFRKES